MIDFSAVEKSVQQLKNQLATGKIDERNFEDQLLEMVDKAEDGYYWMFGHESEQWFRHDGHKWVVDNPAKIKARSLGQKPAVNLAEINWGWFVASLLLLIVISWIVYTASMMA